MACPNPRARRRPAASCRHPRSSDPSRSPLHQPRHTSTERGRPERAEPLLRRYLERNGEWNERQEEEVVRSLEERFRTAVSQAEKAPRPRLESMFEDVYERPTWNLEEQRAELLAAPHRAHSE